MSYSNFQDRNLPFAIKYVADLSKFRHLCWNLVGSDLRSRFRRSRLGILWAVIQPLAFSMIVAAVWGTVFKADSYLTFAVYVFSGMIVWEFFLTSCTMALESLVNAQGYLKQARIPFFIFQLRTPMTGLVILSFGIIGLVIMMLAVGQFPPPGLHLLLVPLHFALMLLFVTPACIFFSIVGAHFRDSRYIVNIAFQALFFVSPVMLSREVLAKPSLHLLQVLNPVVPLIDMLRDPLVYGKGWRLHEVAALLAWTAGLWTIAILASVRAGRKVIFAL